MKQFLVNISNINDVNNCSTNPICICIYQNANLLSFICLLLLNRNIVFDAI